MSVVLEKRISRSFLQILSLYLFTCQQGTSGLSKLDFLPLEINSFDDKTKCWADSGDILLHDSFHNGCFTGIVKAPTWASVKTEFPELCQAHTA